MRLLTYGIGAKTRLGIEVVDRVVDLPGGYAALPEQARGEGTMPPPNDMLALLQAGEPALAGAAAVAGFFTERLRAGAQVAGPAGEQVVYDRGEVRILAPVARPPKIFCLGRNYADHVAEVGGELPKSPEIFSKMATAIIGPGDPIILPPPRIASQIDYEGEFAFVIGKRGKYIPRERALDHVVGYTMLNDVSARDIQFSETQLLRAKSFDTFAPTGPYIVTKDEIPDPHALDIKLWLNGQLMQSSNTKQLIFGVDYLVSYLSDVFTLEPGDIVSTGTPSGPGYFRKPQVLLRPGDVVRIEVTNLGVLENPVAQEPHA